MDENEPKVHHIAEQRCKEFGCKYMGCLRSGKQQSDCMSLFRAFQMCKQVEVDSIRQHLRETGQLPGDVYTWKKPGNRKCLNPELIN